MPRAITVNSRAHLATQHTPLLAVGGTTGVYLEHVQQRTPLQLRDHGAASATWLHCHEPRAHFSNPSMRERAVVDVADHSLIEGCDAAVHHRLLSPPPMAVLHHASNHWDKADVSLTDVVTPRCAVQSACGAAAHQKASLPFFALPTLKYYDDSLDAHPFPPPSSDGAMKHAHQCNEPSSDGAMFAPQPLLIAVQHHCELPVGVLKAPQAPHLHDHHRRSPRLHNNTHHNNALAVDCPSPSDPPPLSLTDSHPSVSSLSTTITHDGVAAPVLLRHLVDDCDTTANDISTTTTESLLSPKRIEICCCFGGDPDDGIIDHEESFSCCLTLETTSTSLNSSSSPSSSSMLAMMATSAHCPAYPIHEDRCGDGADDFRLPSSLVEAASDFS